MLKSNLAIALTFIVLALFLSGFDLNQKTPKPDPLLEEIKKHPPKIQEPLSPQIISASGTARVLITRPLKQAKISRLAPLIKEYCEDLGCIAKGDPLKNELYILGNPAVQSIIEQVIQRLDTPSFREPKLLLVKLKGARAEKLAHELRAMFEWHTRSDSVSQLKIQGGADPHLILLSSQSQDVLNLVLHSIRKLDSLTN